jgi:dTDP-4-dehydrorhamnose reductase
LKTKDEGSLRMTILVFGMTGQLARELAVYQAVTCLGRAAADLRDPAACGVAIRAMGPDAVINAAAFTGVDKAEDEEALATIVNGEAPGVMAQVCAELGVPFVSVSSDYVFDGAGVVPWAPQDRPAPLGAYGRSKLAGEQKIRRAGGTVLRTSWVVSAHGNNFVESMVRLGREWDGLNIVADQVGGPTPARDLAGACISMVESLLSEPEKRGIYHFSGAPDVSWADFAREIFRQAGIDCKVRDIPSSDYPTPAQRPLNSRLDCATLAASFAIKRPKWKAGLTEILADILKDLPERPERGAK